MDTSTTFQVPLTFHNISSLRNVPTRSDYIGSSYSTSRNPFVSWGLSRSRLGDDDNAADVSPAGSVIGLQDGSLLLLRRPEILQKQHPVTSPLLSPAAGSRASLTTSTSRSTSPSGSHISPFSVNHRSRIVSGINTEQIEAPKNYVDFDDEPEKLKDMLKGRGAKERRQSLEVHKERPVDGKASAESTLVGRKRRDPPKSLLSATTSPAPTPVSLSAPPSPQAPSRTKMSKDLELLCHILPPRYGSLHRVTGLELLYNNELTAVLQESGDLSIISNRDGKCFSTTRIADMTFLSSDGIKHNHSIHDVWLWTSLRSYVAGENILILASSSIAAESVSSSLDADEHPKERCKVVLLELRTSHLIGTLEVKIEPIGHWFCDGMPQTVGLRYTETRFFEFFALSEDGKFSSRALHILPPVAPVSPVATKEPQESQLNLGSLPLPNPFKSKPKSADDETAVESPLTLGRVRLDDVSVTGEIVSEGPLVDYHISALGDILQGVGWSDKELVAFRYEKGTFSALFSQAMDDVYCAQWINDDVLAVALEARCELYQTIAVDPNGDQVSTTTPAEGVLMQPKLTRTIHTGSFDAVEFLSDSELIVVANDGSRQISHYSWNERQQASEETTRRIWKHSRGASRSIKSANLTAMMTLDMDMIILGYSDGRLRQTSYLKLCDERFSAYDCPPCSDVALDCSIVSLHSAKNVRTNQQFIIGGGDDGSIVIWTLELKLCARWTMFTTPLHRTARIPDVKGGPLRGSVLCISEDGTIAVIALDGFQFLYVIPGSPFALQGIHLAENNLLLVYADQRVRLWDIKTREFWRSMSLDKAEELINQGGWTEITTVPSSDSTLTPLTGLTRSLDFACTVSLDFNRFISDSLAVAKTISTNRKQTRNILLAREHLRSALSLLLTPGLNQDIDEICYDHLGVKRSNASVGLTRNGFVSLYHFSRPQHCWSLSGDVSAARALAIVATLRALSVFEELSENSTTVTAFYTTGLAGPVGPTYRPPNLAFLARTWFESSNELRHSARLLFDAAVVRLTDEETNTIVDEWQHQLPCLQPTADKESALAALALFLCGYLAADKYSMLSTSALTDIAKSIAMYLHDEQSMFRILAIDLCSRGFHVWQHYIDALEILRSLFSLATSSKKENITAQNVGAQARSAILHIASTNTPLFMTTLGLDILNPSSTEQRRSVMQIVAFLIKKRPLVLYPNLPKLMEAVVKSLDPNSTSNRDAVLDTATEILGHVVKTFPNVDFHMSSQRLAVGTSEGAMVMYDLKTAIRLYVLEGHKKSITACSFSPDGRRLVTLSLEESVVLVWKVGTSFVSFFNPGAPPRQGHAGSEPFKTLSFNVGDAADMSVAGTLEYVRFEWTAERSVKLKIRDSILTFST